MMTTHLEFVTAAYGISAVTLAILIGWIIFDGRARSRELAALEEQGVRRRSERRKTRA